MYKKGSDWWNEELELLLKEEREVYGQYLQGRTVRSTRECGSRSREWYDS